METTTDQGLLHVISSRRWLSREQKLMGIATHLFAYSAHTKDMALDRVERPRNGAPDDVRITGPGEIEWGMVVSGGDESWAVKVVEVRRLRIRAYSPSSAADISAAWKAFCTDARLLVSVMVARAAVLTTRPTISRISARGRSPPPAITSRAPAVFWKSARQL